MQYYKLISNSDGILHTGGGSKESPKFCVRTKWMLPDGRLLFVTANFTNEAVTV